MKEQSKLEIPEIPATVTTFQIAGAVLVFVGVIFGAEGAENHVIASVGGISGGLLFFGVAYGLRKLYQIENHLRLRRIEAERHVIRIEESLSRVESSLQRN